MKKLILAFLSLTLISGSVANAKPGIDEGPFKLGVQAAHAGTLDDSRTLHAKKKSKSAKKAKKSKKSKKGTETEESSKTD